MSLSDLSDDQVAAKVAGYIAQTKKYMEEALSRLCAEGETGNVSAQAAHEQMGIAYGHLLICRSHAMYAGRMIQHDPATYMGGS
jgi:hypothetical protein